MSRMGRSQAASLSPMETGVYFIQALDCQVGDLIEYVPDGGGKKAQ